MHPTRFIVGTILVLVSLSLQTVAYAEDTSAYKLAYISFYDNEIWTMNPDGSDAQQITHADTTKVNLIVSSDGHYLAYYGDSYYDNTSGLTYQKLVVVNIDSGKTQIVNGNEAITGITWSPNS